MSEDDRHPLVKGMHSLFNKQAQDTAELGSPQPKIEEMTEDPLKLILIGMLTESTGVDILDSGGDSGRMWQRNRQIEDWDKTEPINIEVWKDGDFMMTAAVYHYLLEVLDRDEEVKQLEKEFFAYAEANDDCWLVNMEDWAKSKGYEANVHNTYNGECMLSQTLQYVWIDGYDIGGDLILLQIHNGADVRGGYTKPRLFRVDEGFIFYNDFDAYCLKCKNQWDTNDGGYHWYHSSGSSVEDEKYPFEVTQDTEETISKRAIHKGCGGRLQFSNKGGSTNVDE